MILPQKFRRYLFRRVEAALGHGRAIEIFRPAVPSALLNLKKIVRVVEDVAAAAHVRAVVRRPKLVVLIELQAEGVFQAPCNSP